jgi:hypothetical protein
MKPVRLQLSRKKGFDLQGYSRRLNGLPAVVVSRPARWSNPWPIGSKDGGHILTRAEVIDRYERHIAERHGEIRKELAGKNLACWCKEGLRCHADLLLRIANKRPRSKLSASAVAAEQKPNQNQKRNRHPQDPKQ